MSVIVPVYNVEDYLSECLESILNQSFRDLEVICINDGSTDSSLEILKSYAQNDTRIKIITQKNHGLGHARNRGLEKAAGEYIMFVDSDDFIFPDSIRLLYDNAVKNNSDFVAFKYTSDLSSMGSPGFNFIPDFKPGTDFDNLTFDYKAIKTHVLNGFTNIWIQFFKKEFLDKYDDFVFQQNIAYEDVLFHVKSFIRAERISYLPRVCYYYRQRQDSIMGSCKHTFDIFTIIQSVFDFLAENNLEDEFRDEFNYFKIFHTIYYLIFTNSEEYFQKTKEEFSKIKLTSNHVFDENNAGLYNLELYNLQLYELVLKCSSFNQYLNEFYRFSNNQIQLLNLKNINLENTLSQKQKEIINLKTELSEKSKKINKLKNKMELYKSRKAVIIADKIKRLF